MFKIISKYTMTVCATKINFQKEMISLKSLYSLYSSFFFIEYQNSFNATELKK